MYRGNWGRAVLSRVAAVALLCLLPAWLAGEVGRMELAEMDKMSHEELRAYLREGASASFVESYFVSLASFAVLVGLTEALAAGFRAVVPNVPQEEPVASRGR